MIKKLNLNANKIVKEVLDTQIDSYKVEAEIIGFYDIPPLKDTVDKLKKCNEIFYGYYIEDVLVGIISYKIIENVMDIHRVAIKPDYFRMGIGGKLIKYIEKINKGINKITVCTGSKNLAAINLYIKNGYKRIEDIEISKGVYLTKFEKVDKNN